MMDKPQEFCGHVFCSVIFHTPVVSCEQRRLTEGAEGQVVWGSGKHLVATQGFSGADAPFSACFSCRKHSANKARRAELMIADAASSVVMMSMTTRMMMMTMTIAMRMMIRLP